MFAEIFSKNSSLDESSICSPAFPSRINPRLHSIPVTLGLVKKVIIDLDSWKVTCPGYVSVLVLKNCEPELSYVLLAYHDHGPGKSWKVLEFEKSPELLISFKKCPGLFWDSYMSKENFDHLLSFSRYFIMIGFQIVYNNVIIVIYISEENLN